MIYDVGSDDAFFEFEEFEDHHLPHFDHELFCDVVEDHLHDLVEDLLGLFLVEEALDDGVDEDLLFLGEVLDALGDEPRPDFLLEESALGIGGGWNTLAKRAQLIWKLKRSSLSVGMER